MVYDIGNAFANENLKCTKVVGVTVDTKIVLYELLWLFLW